MKSKNPIGVEALIGRCKLPATIRFDDDPISVVMPPRMQMKLSGIITRWGSVPRLAAMVAIMGMKMTTTGVLLRKALAAPAASSPTRRAVPRRCRPSRVMVRAGSASAPVWNSPSPITNSARMANKTGLAKPANNAAASSVSPAGVMTGTSVTSSVSSATDPRLDSSVGMRSRANRMIVPATITNVATRAKSAAAMVIVSAVRPRP